MNILVIGGGGREHALAWKMAQSPLADTVYITPGNAGTARERGMENIACESNVDSWVALAQKVNAELVVVGPEAPLVDGVVDALKACGIAAFGPTANAAQLEGSKAFAKDFMARHAIPTARYENFDNADAALTWLDQQSGRWVVKADGLAAGKGVIVCDDIEGAKAAVRECFDGQFGEAGSRVVIEEFLEGEEASYIAIVAGNSIVPMASSQDHKARDNADLGPNTGGMGAYSPAPVVDEAMEARILARVIEPTIKGLASDGIDYCGFLYAGVMIDAEGNPRVLEFNCRFGDPETQPIMMRMRSDIVPILLAAARGESLDSLSIQWDQRAALGVVLAANGYPGSYAKGDVIGGLEAIDDVNTKVFHAGTALSGDTIVSSGGRVLCITALGDSVASAQERAYSAVKNVQWTNAYYRTDIGYRAVEREIKT